MNDELMNSENSKTSDPKRLSIRSLKSQYLQYMEKYKK